MSFTETDKAKALAIVHIFETSRPFGDYAACVVLNDGAGVSYGINQFTHRSGSLLAVVREYLRSPNLPAQHRRVLEGCLPSLSDKTPAAVEHLSHDSVFKQVLREAAADPAMRAAQQSVAFSLYLRPALQICSRFGFVLPLSLAVVYDSVTHGSWDLISARVGVVRTTFRGGSSDEFEKAWISEYVARRHRWLTEVRRLRSTNYRTRFFLAQIGGQNWKLDLPLSVQGVRLTNESIARSLDEEPGTVAEPPGSAVNAVSADETTVSSHAEHPSVMDKAGALANEALARFDRVDRVVGTVRARSDAAKSLWTTVAGTATQMAWAVFGFVAGLPRVVWVVVAITAAALTLLYLHRQVALGKIRETRVM
jgi:chitosanase